jgi:hypothetical protein
MKRISILTLLAVAVAALPAAAAPVTFTSLASWTTAMSGNTIIVEPFTGSLLATTVVSPLPGSNAHDTGYPSIGAITGTCNGCSGTVWRDRLDTSPLYTTTFSYSGGPIMGFGAVWDTGPNDEGSGILITVYYQGGGSEVLTPTIDNYDGWRGWTFTSPVSYFVLSTPNSGVQVETFQMDDLRFAVAPVPEPATFALLGVALLGLGFWRRKRA